MNSTDIIDTIDIISTDCNNNDIIISYPLYSVLVDTYT